MEKPTSQLVEEAVQAVKNGEISLETGASRYGPAWLEIRGEVAMILDLEKTGQAFKANLPAPNLDKIWAGILPELTLVQVLPLSEDTEPAAAPAAQLGVLTFSSNGSKPAPKVAPLKTEADPPPPPAKVTFFQKWRKPLTLAAAFALVVVISLTSLVGVANAAEPGDFFYGTKLWLDSTRQVFAFSPEDKVNATLSYCENRSKEMEWVVRNGKLEYIASLSGDYRQNLQKVTGSGAKNLTSKQAKVIKDQQARLAQLNTELEKNSSANPASVSQASQNITTLVQELQKVENPNQPATTPTPGASPSTGPKATGTPTATVTGTPTLTTTLAVTATVTVATTVTTTLVATTPGITPLPPDTTGAATTAVGGVETQLPTPDSNSQPTPVEVPKQGNPAPQPAPVTAIRPVATPTPTPAVIGQGNNQNNSDSDDLNGNNHGSPVNAPANPPATPANQPAQPPTAKQPAPPPTANPPAPQPTPNPPATPAGPVEPEAKPPAPTPEPDKGKPEKPTPEPKDTKEPKDPKTEKTTQAPKDTPTPKPTPTPKDTKKPKDNSETILLITDNLLTAIQKLSK